VVAYDRALEAEGERSTLRRSVAADSEENCDSMSESAVGQSARVV
jgi:hypothetical protein